MILKKIKKLILISTLFVGLLVFIIGLYTARRFFPLDYTNVILHYSYIHGVDHLLVASIINVESGFNRYAVSPAGASGLMQIMPLTAYWIAEHLGIENFNYEEMIFNPVININMGTWYISRLISSHYNIETALAAYNAGSGNVANWLTDENLSLDGKVLIHIPFPETRNYVSRVSLVRRIYAILWPFRGFL